MTPEEVADRLIAAPASAGATLRRYGAPAGLNAAFMGRLLRLFASDHGAVRRLGPVARRLVDRGDDPALAWRAVGIVERVRGRWRASAEAFRQAGERATNPRDRYAFQTGAVDCLAHAGDVDAAVALGQSLIAGLDALGETGLSARVALNVGTALMERDRYEEAWGYLEGLAPRLAQAGFLVEAASARLSLSTSLLFGGSVRRAKSEARAAAEAADEEALDLLADIARGNVAYANLLSGDADLAVADLLPLRDRQNDAPVERVRVLEFLGDAYAAMNLWNEAADAYREALSHGSAVTSLRRAHLRLGMGQALLASGDAEGALRELTHAARRYRRLGNLAWAAAAETDRAQALASLGRPSRRRIAEAVTLAEKAESPYHLARALLVSAEQGGPEDRLARAEAMIRSYRLDRLKWPLEAEKARRAEGSKRLRDYRRMFRAILGEQARMSSFASRLGYLRDKTEALRGYLSELLAKPTAKRVAEAIDVVTRSRSIALLDEVAQARRVELDAEARDRLAELRLALNERASELPTQEYRLKETRRKGSAGSAGLDRLQRRWLEETYEITHGLGVPSEASEESVVFVETGGRLQALSGGEHPSRAILPIDVAELRARLRWLVYDLMAPMTDRNVDGPCPLAELRELGQAILSPIVNRAGTIGVCPDGILWRMPWLACLDAMGASDRALEVRVHPSLRGREPQMDRRPMLWVATHGDLPWAAREAEAFLARYPDAEVCRSAAEVRARLAGGGVSALHVVSHASYRAGHPMLSSLDFVDGPVLATEIARSGLRADLVTLSGCDTGRLSDVNRLEPDGLVRAFLACGAGYVVGSAWPLDDEAASRLYASFYEAVDNGAKTHEALRIARGDVRRWMKHPYFWASPLLYGGYRT